MTQTEALKLALEALENVEFVSGSTDWVDDCVAAAEAIKEALAQPEQRSNEHLDPMAYGWFYKGSFYQSNPSDWADLNFPVVALYPHHPQPKESKQKPAAWWIPKAEQFCLPSTDGTRPFARAWEPLYTTPPQRKPLPYERVADLWLARFDTNEYDEVFMNFARAIEAAHGIKE